MQPLQAGVCVQSVQAGLRRVQSVQARLRRVQPVQARLRRVQSVQARLRRMQSLQAQEQLTPSRAAAGLRAGRAFPGPRRRRAPRPFHTSGR